MKTLANRKRGFVNAYTERIWKMQKMITVLNPLYEDLWDLLGHLLPAPVEGDDDATSLEGPYLHAISVMDTRHYWIRVTAAKPEWVVENVLGPIHRKYGVTWSMYVRGEDHIEWKSTDIPDMGDHHIEVDAYNTIDCAIKHTQVFTYTPDKYEMECAA